MHTIKAIGWALGLAFLGLGWAIGFIGAVVCLWPEPHFWPFVFYLATGGSCAACFHEVATHPPSSWRK